MNLYEIMFFLSLLCLIGIVITRAFNIFSLARKYDIKISIILFFITMISWYICMVAFLRNYSDYFILDMLNMFNLLFRLSNFLFAAESMIYIYHVLEDYLIKKNIIRKRYVPVQKN